MGKQNNNSKYFNDNIIRLINEMENASLEMYFITKEAINSEYEISQADIVDQTLLEIKKELIDNLKKVHLNINERLIQKLSHADERKDTIYYYDYDERPTDMVDFDIFRKNTNISYYNFKEKKINSIKANIFSFYIDEQTKIILYKQVAPVVLIDKDKTFLLSWGNEEKICKLKNDVIKLGFDCDFIDINGRLYITNLSVLERNFKFHDVIVREAMNGIKNIEKTGLLENPESLEEMLENVSYARKLSKIHETSPVLGKIPNKEIVSFVQSNPILSKKIKISSDGTKLSLGSQNSKRAFIALLNDNYLYSLLTKHMYESIAKDNLE